MAQQDHDAGFLTLSNLLSLARIPLGAAFIGVTDQTILGLLIVAAAVTDGLDGFIARVSGTRSQIGLMLDPMCDKLFVLFALTAFLSRGQLEPAAFMILILRDLFAVGTYLAARMVGFVIPFRPRWAGKIATGLQLLTLLALIYGPRYVPLLVLLVGVMSVLSIIDYGDRALRRSWGGQTA
ncbi:MAG: CDP-alcohol phosphatidyltransferase family protein [Gemmatimonadota bacterium]|nr:CDP-alcohol phosphatidyltransferase family protein [Gemmatimonadota bacterium]